MMRASGQAITTSASVVLLVLMSSQAFAQHEGDLVVGQVGGRLVLEYDFDESVELAPVAVNPFGLAGWASDEPGFDHADGADPDLGALSPGADIRLVGMSPFDAALKVRFPQVPFDVAIGAMGGALPLGGHDLHAHAFWHVDATDAGFDPMQTIWTGTFRLVDLGTTGYADSEPFALSFTVVPEPAVLALLAVGGPVLARRRRRRQS